MVRLRIWSFKKKNRTDHESRCHLLKKTLKGRPSGGGLRVWAYWRSDQRRLGTERKKKEGEEGVGGGRDHAAKINPVPRRALV